MAFLPKDILRCSDFVGFSQILFLGYLTSILLFLRLQLLQNSPNYFLEDSIFWKPSKNTTDLEATPLWVFVRSVPHLNYKTNCSLLPLGIYNPSTLPKLSLEEIINSWKLPRMEEMLPRKLTESFGVFVSLSSYLVH